MPSYRKKNIKSKIHKIKPRKSILKRRWFWFSILILIIVSVIIYFSFFYSGFQLKNIIISGNIKVKTSNLYSVAYEDANTNLISLGKIKITSRSIFWIDESRINRDILAQFPDVERLTMNRDFPQTLVLVVQERKPVGVFCPSSSDDFSAQTNLGCFLIDQSGVIFNPLAVITSGMTIVRENMGDSQVYAGQGVVTKNAISAIAKIQKTLKDDFQIDLTQALITGPVRLNIDTGENWHIYFDLSPDSSVDTQLSELGLLLNGGISADSRKNLRYIDLRPKDRAIVCDNKVCGG